MRKMVFHLNLVSSPFKILNKQEHALSLHICQKNLDNQYYHIMNIMLNREIKNNGEQKDIGVHV